MRQLDLFMRCKGLRLKVELHIFLGVSNISNNRSYGRAQPYDMYSFGSTVTNQSRIFQALPQSRLKRLERD